MGIKERKERENLEMKSKIILAAADLLSKHGHERLTIRMLAREIEYSPRTVYLYFKDKDDLLRSIVEYAFGETLKKLPPPEVAERLPPMELLDQTCRNHISRATDDPEFYRTVVHLLLEKGYPPGPNERAIMEFAERTMLRCLGRNRSEHDPVSVEFFTLLSMLRGFSLFVGGSGMTGRERENAIEVFMKYLTGSIREYAKTSGGDA